MSKNSAPSQKEFSFRCILRTFIAFVEFFFLTLDLSVIFFSFLRASYESPKFFLNSTLISCILTRRYMWEYYHEPTQLIMVSFPHTISCFYELSWKMLCVRLLSFSCDKQLVTHLFPSNLEITTVYKESNR